MILKMKENESMTKHLHTFRTLLDQLSTASSPMSDEDAVLALMRSMPPSYRNFLISIRGQTLSLQTLITYLLQEEMMIKNLDNVIESSSSSSSSALALRSNKPWNKQGYSKFSSRPYNTKNYQNHQNHQNNKNYQRYQSKNRPSNFQPGYQNNNQSNSNRSYNQRPLVCFYCGKPNHHQRDCRKRIYDETNGTQNPTSTNNNNKELLYIAAYNTQLTNQNTWIVDSGATRYMAYNQNLFLKYKILSPGQHAYTIDGTSHAIQGIGNVKIILSNGI